MVTLSPNAHLTYKSETPRKLKVLSCSYLSVDGLSVTRPQ